jgi:hypothetical protein
VWNFQNNFFPPWRFEGFGSIVGTVGIPTTFYICTIIHLYVGVKNS